MVKIVVSFSPFWKYVYKEYGLVSTIFSLRDNLLINALNYIEKYWSCLNYLFGGIDYSNIRSEFGVFDLFLAFGVLGLVLYSYFLNAFFFKGQEKIVLYLMFSLLIIEALSGGLFTNILPMILFYFTSQYLKSYSLIE
jgi:hypothetical protein